MHITGITKSGPGFYLYNVIPGSYSDPGANKQRYMILKRRIFNSQYLQ